MPNGQYKSPRAFRDAFERRYRDDPRRALVLVMQRFAARVCTAIEGAVLKGGLGLEMRLDTPRTTKDADIIIAGSHDLDARMARAGDLDLGDFLKFRVAPAKGESEFDAPGMAYPAKRYTVQAFFADRLPGQSQQPFRRFSAEVSIRSPAGFDLMSSQLEGFPQAESASIRVYSLHWQIAEKVHAYTDSRHREATNPNLMRPRDLLDLCRCATATTPDAEVESAAMREALEQTFARRKLQQLPTRLPPLPNTWQELFHKQVAEAGLPWTTPASAHAVAADFIDPVLDDTASGRWQPATKVWG